MNPEAKTSSLRIIEQITSDSKEKKAASYKSAILEKVKGKHTNSTKRRNTSI